jgi:hypothetical protein
VKGSPSAKDWIAGFRRERGATRQIPQDCWVFETVGCSLQSRVCGAQEQHGEHSRLPNRRPARVHAQHLAPADVLPRDIESVETWQVRRDLPGFRPRNRYHHIFCRCPSRTFTADVGGRLSADRRSPPPARCRPQELWDANVTALWGPMAPRGRSSFWGGYQLGVTICVVNWSGPR